MNPSTEPILDAANKFLWSDEMQESMDGFASNYGEMFVGVTRQQAAGRAEQKLEWTEAHNEFSQLFEFHLEQFLETQPFSTEDLNSVGMLPPVTRHSISKSASSKGSM